MPAMNPIEPARPGLIDRIVAAVSPRYAAEREADRAALNELRRFGRARPGRNRSSRKRGQSGPGDLFGDDRLEEIERARQLQRQSLLARGLVKRSVDNVIGSQGIRTTATTDDPAWNEKATKLFTAWAKDKKKCDARGMRNFYAMQRCAFRALLVDGETEAIKLTSGPKRGRLQLLEADQIGLPGGRNSLQRNLADGVELDRFGEPVAFRVLSEPYDDSNVTPREALTKWTPVPARDMIYLPNTPRSSDTRGQSGTAALAEMIDQIDGYANATILTARMAACFGVVVTRKRRANLSRGTDGRRRQRIQPGMYWEIEPGEKVDTISPGQPNGNFEDLLLMMIRLVAQDLGLPVEIAFLMFGKVNYSVMKAAHTQAKVTWKCKQTLMGDDYVSDVWRWKIDQFVAEGKLTARPDQHEHQHTYPGWTYVDPPREIAADLTAVAGGFKSYTEVHAHRPGGFEGFLKERKADEELIAKFGLTFTIPGVPPAQPDGDSDDDGNGGDGDDDNDEDDDPKSGDKRDGDGVIDE